MNTLELSSLLEWREWLTENHERVLEVWVVFDRKKPVFRYEESLEEALCFGWVDSLIKNIDTDRHARKFTPRRSGSTWSAANINRAERMIE